MSLTATRLVWEHARASGSAMVVLLALADHANDDFEAWPSQATLARLAKVSDRQIRTILAELVQAGDIEVAGAARRGVVAYRISCDRHQQNNADLERRQDPTPEVEFRGATSEAGFQTPEAQFRTPEVGFRPSTPEADFQTPEVEFRGENATPEAGFRSTR